MTQAARLAIVVPAWKPQFLAQALQSIADQASDDVDCLLFDDAGPPDVERIAARFPRFRYSRFDSNLGGQSLVGHWNRCLAQVQNEWVWLFSDDDVMLPGSVQAVLDAIAAAAAATPPVLVLQLPVQMVSEDLQQVLWASEPPRFESADDFIRARMGGRRLSCLPDHVFRWESLRQLHGGVVDLPLAWNADDATWFLLGRQGGLVAVPTARVLWRQSALNISADQRQRWLKLHADLEFLGLLRRWGAARGTQRLAPRWLAKRLLDVYGFSLADAAALGRRLPLRWWTAALPALARGSWRHWRASRGVRASRAAA